MSLNDWILMLVQALVFVGYTWWGVKNSSTFPKSISETYYLVPKKYKVVFTIFCWFTGFSAIFLIQEPLIFFAGAGLVFVGAATDFKEEMTCKVHVTAAMSAVLLSQLHFILNGVYVPTVLLVAVFVYTKLIKKEYAYVLWVELAAFVGFPLYKFIFSYKLQVIEPIIKKVLEWI